MTKVYQVQTRSSYYVPEVDGWEYFWNPYKTKSGGSFCNTLRGAKASAKQCGRDYRIVSFELTNEKVEYLSE